MFTSRGNINMQNVKNGLKLIVNRVKYMYGCCILFVLRMLSHSQSSHHTPIIVISAQANHYLPKR